MTKTAIDSMAAEVIRYAHLSGYTVTDGGAVISPALKVRKVRRHSKESPYLCFSLYFTDGKVHRVMVHRLQAFQKFGESIFDPALVVRHRNNQALDNSKENVILGTPTDNAQDIPYELRCRASRVAHAGRRQFPTYVIRYIWDAIRAGCLYTEIASVLGVAASTIRGIAYGTRYPEMRPADADQYVTGHKRVSHGDLAKELFIQAKVRLDEVKT